MTPDWLQQQFERERLHRAAEDGNVPLIGQLIDAGLDINAFDELGRTPLHYAAQREHLDAVRYLISRGADVNARHEPTISNTPLADIASSCTFEMAKLLVDSGADPTIEGWMRLNALHRAKDRKRDEGRRVYELLVKKAGRHA
jgi:ankyrin repeat protein